MEFQYSIRYEKYIDSLESLKKIETIEWPKDKDLYGFIWCGVISKFCITFDLSYKLMKDILIEYHGVTNFAKGSPRESLKASYQSGVIDDEIWLDMLRDRKEIVHEYKDFGSVDDWCKKIVENYIPLMDGLKRYFNTHIILHSN